MRTETAEASPCFLANRAYVTSATLAVANKHTGEEARRVCLAGPKEIERAISAAADAAEPLRRMPAYARAAVLRHVADRLTQRSDEAARAMVIEVGKPIREARGEVARACDTFRFAAEEATRINGHYLPLDVSARSATAEGLVKRVPVGPCSFITPFNFPLNLAAHKVGPAIAAGCPFVLKPSDRTPLTSLILGEILAETELPPGTFSILPCLVEHAGPLTTDDRIKLLSFTGSGEVGWKLKSLAGRKKVVLELGGDAACIVDAGTDLGPAVSRLTIGAFSNAGQSCISVQRILVHTSIYEELRDRLVAVAGRLVCGDPMRNDTDIGPLISRQDAERVEAWVNHAQQRGARLLCGGPRTGSIYPPTLLDNVPAGVEISTREVFGPVAILEAFSDFGAACRRVNESRYGLQAGVFTPSLHHAFHAWNELEVGGVIINDVPTFRVESMPYGGVKESGFGAQGIRATIEELTEPRLMVLNGVGRA